MMNLPIGLLAAEATKATTAGPYALVALVVFIFASLWIGALANRKTREGSFMTGFFLGNRGLGAWALALTATVQSGGTFMGTPSLIYTHGWIVALWIGSYMVVPITGFGILGKRLAQLSRRTGAITVPDLFRARFGSPALGLVASLFILLYLSFMMFAQFKSGALVMKIAWPGSGVLSVNEDQLPFSLSATALEELKQGKEGKDGLPDEVAEKLAPVVGEGFQTERGLNERLKELLSAEELAKYKSSVVASSRQMDRLYLYGLVIFSLTVVAYTLMGGFLAAVWTDMFQSVLMFFGVIILLYASLTHPQIGSLEVATKKAIENTGGGPGYAFGPGYDDPNNGPKADPKAEKVPRMAYDPTRPREFLPLTIAISFFCVWVWSGVGSPASLVRLMASQNTEVIRRSIYLLSVYNLGIYLPLIVICMCGRALIPSLPGQTDEIIPQMALLTTKDWMGGSLVAGLILAAPFGAVMSTVSSYLVVLSSGIVRDIYQRFLRPQASPGELRKAAYLSMIVVGVIAIVVNIYPVEYLQAFIVFSATGSAATFLIPAVMACYWRRATVPGVLSSMIGGAGTMLSLYLLGIFEVFDEQRIDQLTRFRPYYLLEFHPFVWGVLVSGVSGILVSLATTPPDQALLSKMFDKETSSV
jgi:SSS family solute:Na+ symporter/sodium/pantothenate symporter